MIKTNQDLDFYRDIYQTDHTPWSKLDQLDRRTEHWLQSVVESPSKPQRMLDLGTGHGRMVDLFDSYGFFATGVDLVRKPLLTAQLETSSGAPFLQADAFQLPFNSYSFSALVDYGLLHHVRKTDWSRYRDGILTRLHPGGYFFTSVFHTSDEHANVTQKRWVHHRGHYDRFFEREHLDQFLGSDFTRLDSDIIHDGDHAFLHAVYRKTS